MNGSNMEAISYDVPNLNDTRELCSVIIHPSHVESSGFAADDGLRAAGAPPSTSNNPRQDEDSHLRPGFSIESLVNKDSTDYDKLAMPFHCRHVGCKKSFVNDNNLKRHMSVVHLKKKLCIRCSSDLTKSSSSVLKDDSGVVYCTKHVYRCSSCLISFGEFHQEKKGHVQRTLSLFSCDQCSFQYFTPRDLNRHYRSHAAYECCFTECASRVFNGISLQQHYASQHKKNVKDCVTCGKTFENKAMLREHVLSHLKTELREYFECPYKEMGCKRKYLHKRNLNQHIACAHKHVVFKCNKCAATLSTKQKLKQHVLTMHKLDIPSIHFKISVARPTMTQKMLGMRMLKLVGGKSTESAQFALKKPKTLTKKKQKMGNKYLENTESKENSITLSNGMVVETPKPLHDWFKTQPPEEFDALVNTLLENRKSKNGEMPKDNPDALACLEQPFIQYLY